MITDQTKEQQIRELAAFICPACDMHGYTMPCCEGNDPTKCGISREVAEAIYNAGYRKNEEPKREETKRENTTIAMEGPNRFKEAKYTPTCPHGYDDCIYDPAYIKASSPEWYVTLYGDKAPEEVARDAGSCGRCIDGEFYDDEDK